MLRGSFTMAVKAWPAPLYSSRTPQKRPRPSSSKPLQENETQCFAASFTMAVKSMACPFAPSRTWQERPHPSSSKPLSRGSDARLRRFFRYGRQSMACPFALVSHSAKAPSPLVLKAPFERIRCRASRFFRYGRQSMACPFTLVSHTAEAPSPLALKAPFERKRRKASRFFRRVRQSIAARSPRLALGRSALAPRPQSPFREDTMQSFAVLSLWPAKHGLPLHSRLAHRRSALAPRPQSPFREEAPQGFAVLSPRPSKYSRPFAPSRTWQKRPRPSSSKPLSRGCDAELRGSFVMAGKPWPAPLYSSHTPQKRPQSRLSARFKRKRRKASPLLPLWLSKHDLPMRPVSHLAGAPSPLVLSAPFKRKRRKASRFFRRVRPQKTRNH